MTSRAQRVLVVVVIDPRWRLELRQEDSLAATPAVLTTINADRGVSFHTKTRNLKKYGFKIFQENTLNRQRTIEFVVNTSKVVRRLTKRIPEEEDETRDVASVRIHVERAIERVKNFNILTQIIPNSMAEDLNKIWKVCALLSNLKGCLVT